MDKKTATPNLNKEILALFSGQANTITVPSLYIKLTGGRYTRANVLNQCVYWSNKSELGGGWFHKEYDEWYEETLIPERTLRRIFTEFEQEGWIETKVKKVRGLNTKTIRPHIDKIMEAIVNLLSVQNLPQPAKVAERPIGQNGRSEPAKMSESIYTDKNIQITTTNNNAGSPHVDNFIKDDAQISDPSKITYSEKEAFGFGSHNIEVENRLNNFLVETEQQKAKREAIESEQNIAAFNTKFHDRQIEIERLYDIAQEKLGTDTRPVKVNGFYKYIIQERPTNWPTKTESKTKQVYPKTSLTPDENKFIQDYCSQLKAKRKPQSELTEQINAIKRRLKATFAPWAREVLAAIEKAEEIGDSGMYKVIVSQAQDRIRSEEGCRALKEMKDLLR